MKTSTNTGRRCQAPRMRALLQGACIGLLTSTEGAAGSGNGPLSANSSDGSLDPDTWAWTRALQLHFDGWVNAGVTYNPTQPGDRYNGPVSFSDRANELQLNQLYLYMERKPLAESRAWQFGGRLDFMFGSDAVFTRSLGDPGEHWDAQLLHDRIYGIALPQAYVEIVPPEHYRVKVKIGEFYTIVGNEAVIAPENFFHSHSYTMQYGEPFSHTGLLTEYRLTDALVMKAGAVTGSHLGGWDGGFQYGLNNWAFVGSLQWTPEAQNYTVLLSGTHGHLRGSGDQDINLYSAVLHLDPTARWHAVLQFDNGWITAGKEATASEWHGLVGYLTYDITDRLAAGLRAEWFRDDDGARVTTSAREPLVTLPAANYYGLTLGLNWKPGSRFVIRPSVRYDVSDANNAFAAGGADDQWLFSIDAIVLAR